MPRILRVIAKSGIWPTNKLRAHGKMAEQSESALTLSNEFTSKSLTSIQRMSQDLLVEGILSISSLERGVGSPLLSFFAPLLSWGSYLLCWNPGLHFFFLSEDGHDLVPSKARTVEPKITET